MNEAPMASASRRVGAWVWERVDRVLGRIALDPEDGTALGLLRVLVVAVLTLSLLSHVGAVSEYFSTDAPLHGQWARKAFPSRFSLFFWVDSPWAVRAIFSLGVVAHLMWLVGWRTTIASAVAWLVWVSMVGRQPLLYSLPDQLQMAMCTLLMLMPSGRALSVDARRRGARPVPVWCRRMIQLQLACMYTATGLLKTGSTWREHGTALYYALVSPYNRHFDVAPVLAHLQHWVLRPMTWVVLAWEIGFAGFVLLQGARTLAGRPRRWPDLRIPYLGFGVLMHLGIQAMLYVAWFSPLVLASYAAFVRPEEARRWLARLGLNSVGLIEDQSDAVYQSFRRPWGRPPPVGQSPPGTPLPSDGSHSVRSCLAREPKQDRPTP